MKTHRPYVTIAVAVSLVFAPIGTCAEEVHEAADTAAAKNVFSADAQFLSRGEIRAGGLPEKEGEDDFAAFIMERTRLIVDYSRPYISARISAQHSGVWGQAGKGTLNLYETWVKLTARNGLFAKIGRQVLAYDNERIIGSDDWAMASASHDVGKFGYEGHGHKVHLLLGFNQNAENTDGGTYYADGAQPYKSMQTLWYHYDVPRINLGASLLFMNLGTQDVTERVTHFQQLAGIYLLWKNKAWLAEGSYYRQFGRSEVNLPIEAWMASIKLQYNVNSQLSFNSGYDYLSGDEFYYVRGEGQAGLIRHKRMQGFSTLYGSHHQFYGAMDFFYLSAYADGFSPGLQNFFVGVEYSPIKKVDLSATYHYLATTIKLDDFNRTLGNEVEIEASYKFLPFATLSAGYTFMAGSATMKELKRSSDKGRLQWAWLTLSVNPRIFTTKW